MKPVEDLTDDELILEMSEKIRLTHKMESEVGDLDRVKNNHTKSLDSVKARKSDLDKEYTKRVKKVK